MRLVCAALLALAASLCQASRILLVPLDNRPAAGQFAQMIADIDGANVQMPPYQFLGRFTTPGNPDAILQWLNEQDMSDVSSVVVSADMIAYGGLIASRTGDISKARALDRLKRLEAFANKVRPNVKVFVFSSVMRIAPTAVKANRGWRSQLARYVVARQRVTPAATLATMRKSIPPAAITGYDATRARNHAVQQELIRMVMTSFDYLVLGQDDAQIYGPHVPETKVLKALTDKLGLNGRVYFCEGVDQNSNILVCRALLKAASWIPRIRVIYSDPYGRIKVGAYESKSVQETVRDQVYASGARISGINEPYDYTLYVNTPDRRPLYFQDFLDDLRNEMDQNLPVCLADINLAPDGTCDRELFDALKNENRLMKLLAFAGWNTAGNTLGTAIPTANITLLSARKKFDPFKREVAQKTFLMHRIVDDVFYHRQTRPRAYALIDALPDAAKEETYGDAYSAITTFVKKDMLDVLARTFTQQLRGQTFSTPAGTYQYTDLQNVKIFLPWPRAYEVRVEFGLAVKAMETTPAKDASVQGSGKSLDKN